VGGADWPVAEKAHSRLEKILTEARSKLKILVGLITGHCPLNKRLHNMGLIDEPICIPCGMEESVSLVILPLKNR
jgi:hypothetical protein